MDDRREHGPDLSISRLIDEGFPTPHLFAHPFAAVSVPTNDPSTPALLAGIVDERFVASVANSPDATVLTPEDIAAGHLPRVAVRSATTPTSSSIGSRLRLTPLSEAAS